MALAAARTRKTAEPGVTLAAVPDPPTLAERLAEATQAAVEPARRVAELEQAMQSALASQDYAAAEALKNQLADARMEHGIAAAAVAGLQSAIVDAERRLAEDARVIQEAQQQAEARRTVEHAMASEQRALAAIDAALEEFFSLAEAAKAKFREAQMWETAAGQERARAHQAMVVLGERPDGVRITKPNRASALTETNNMVVELLRWAR